MVAPGAFPIIKLGALAIRQVAKPLANLIKQRAKTSPFFRDYICMPPAQFYHWLDVNVKMRMLNLGKPREVRKLDQNAAIELGADLLGEAVIFTVAAVTIVSEYMRQSRNSAKAAEELEARWMNAETRIAALEDICKDYVAEINELNKKCYPSKPAKAITLKQAPLVNPDPQSSATGDNNNSSVVAKTDTIEKGAISKAIDTATGKFTKQ